jgi:hypothetical protein
MKTKYRILIVLSCMVMGAFHIQGQALFNSNQKEELALLTDRDIYFSNDELVFWVNYSSKAILAQKNWSNIIYIELLDYTGGVIWQGKIPIVQNKAIGSFKVPDGLFSGNYYLRAYTKWMRNFGPSEYCYKLVTILNTKQNKRLEKKEGYATSYTWKKEPGRKLYSPGAIEKEPNKVIVSVADSNLFYPFNVVLEKKNIANIKRGQIFIPESRGVSLSGKVYLFGSETAAAYVKVNLSILSKPVKNFVTISDSTGKFHFDLGKHSRSSEMFISAFKDGQQLKLVLDKEFCSAKINLPFIPVDSIVEIDSNINACSIKSQLASIFSQPKIIKQKEVVEPDFKLFGIPDEEVFIHEYIDFTNFSDYFLEVVPLVGIRKIKGKLTLKVNGQYSDLLAYEPLILLDDIAIADIDKLLQVSPKKIHSIKVYNKPYYKGSVIYGGIIQISSVNNDLAGIDLPSSGQFFNYTMLMENTVRSDEKLPELNNTVFINKKMQMLNEIPYMVNDGVYFQLFMH